jgi:hypothetical protein
MDKRSTGAVAADMADCVFKNERLPLSFSFKNLATLSCAKASGGGNIWVERRVRGASPSTVVDESDDTNEGMKAHSRLSTSSFP